MLNVGLIREGDVKTSRPQQTGCCIVSSQPSIQLISSRAEAARSFLIVASLSFPTGGQRHASATPECYVLF